ncbi:MAG: STAS domain-containing protein [Zoogloeaceae bacterium]|nr:STAS domain-containing protein [Zoogloeaceae bacterium]
MDVSVRTESDRCVIQVAGRFDFNAHREFRDAITKSLAQVGVPQIQVDLGEVGYLDSSALGMLLMARDKARSAGKTVSLINTRGSVRQVLDIANFGRLFPIS